MSDMHLARRPCIGVLPCGPRGTIADVAGLTVGHRRLSLLDAAPDLVRLLI